VHCPAVRCVAIDVASFANKSRSLVQQFLCLVEFVAELHDLITREPLHSVEYEPIRKATLIATHLEGNGRVAIRTVLFRQPLVFVPAARLFGTDAAA
jgi:hypothetical protein